MCEESVISENFKASLRSLLLNLLRSYKQPMLILDKNGIVHGCNSEILGIYNVKANELINKNIFKLSQEYSIAMPGDSIQNLLEDSNNKITFHRVDKKIFLKYFQWTIFLFPISAKQELVVLLAHDVTSILEAATREQLLLDSLIDSLPVEIFWKDKSLVYLGCNKRFVRSIGLRDKSEIIGKTDFDLPVDKEDSFAFREDDKRVIDSKIPKLDIVERQTFENGDEKFLITSKVPLFDDQGEIYGVLGVYRDITEQKKSENALKVAIKLAEEANCIKSEFIANMSHDIRTPLSGVVGMSQLLMDKLIDPDNKQHAQWIHECGVQLLGLLNDILTIIATDSVKNRQGDVNEEVFSLRQCIEDLVHLERPSTSMKGIALNVVIDDDIPDYLFGDRAGLYRILLNLLGNAIKFTSEGSVGVEVNISSRKDSKLHLHFKVIDTGIGIPIELQDKVFDRFYRVNPSYKGIYAGHGIGLHIAQTYVNRLGGKLKFVSEVGKGTCFYFDLAFSIEEHTNLNISPVIKKEPESAVNFAFNKTPVVLLVEDNCVALKVLESFAKAVKVRFFSVTDGESALDALTKQKFNLIITDIGLPGISGGELTEKIRAWEEKHSYLPVPIVGLTAHARDQVMDECLQVGMNDAYSKPMTLDIMQEIIRKFI